MNSDVVIVGAGPVGLFLAGELRLAGVSVRVLEKLAAPTGLSKALGLTGRAEDYLAMRGLLGRFRARAPKAPPIASLMHFSRIPLDLTRAGVAPKGVFIPQSITEDLFRERALSLGADLRSGVEVAGLTASTGRVTVHTDAGDIVGRYVVGCDGAHSVVRAAIGVGFPGRDATTLLRLGDVRFPEGTPAPQFVVPLGDGWYRLVTREPLDPGFDRREPMTIDELRASVLRSYGVEVAIAEARWLSRFTDASRQAERYRVGHVLLAGDAAHIHLPAGGPGLLTGLGDALNLGWKLGAVVRGDLPDTVLDTYHDERHAVGRRVLLHTRAQGALGDPALRELFGELLAIPAAAAHVAAMLWQTDIRYAVEGPYVGQFLPEFDGRPDLSVLAEGHGLWIDLGGGERYRGVIDGVERLRRIETRADLGIDAILVRPDGHVAWAGGGEEALRQALSMWFKVPATV
jgi:2-polyprenyl-6-methoxyphenol hydroxylase-like FAD-dependent oxidoreductase